MKDKNLWEKGTSVTLDEYINKGEEENKGGRNLANSLQL